MILGGSLCDISLSTLEAVLFVVLPFSLSLYLSWSNTMLYETHLSNRWLASWQKHRNHCIRKRCLYPEAPVLTGLFAKQQAVTMLNFIIWVAPWVSKGAGCRHLAARPSVSASRETIWPSFHFPIGLSVRFVVCCPSNGMFNHGVRQRNRRHCMKAASNSIVQELWRTAVGFHFGFKHGAVYCTNTKAHCCLSMVRCSVGMMWNYLHVVESASFFLKFYWKLSLCWLL